MPVSPIREVVQEDVDPGTPEHTEPPSRVKTKLVTRRPLPRETTAIALRSFLAEKPVAITTGIFEIR